MSMVQDLIAAVMLSEREIDQQIQALNSYNQHIEKSIAEAQQLLVGSVKGHDKKVNAQLQQTSKQVKETISQLQQTKIALERVRMI